MDPGIASLPRIAFGDGYTGIFLRRKKDTYNQQKA
jgi:hypothetical protein